MPGAGFGIHASANVYVYTWKAVTFGLGGDAAFARALAYLRDVGLSLSYRVGSV